MSIGNEDLRGRRLGIFTVLFPALDKQQKDKWVCKCDCGKQFTATYIGLTEGTIKSCGCTKLKTVPADAIEDIYNRLEGKIVPLHRRKKKKGCYYTFRKTWSK